MIDFRRWFQRNNELDSFVALKYNIPSVSARRGEVEAWIFRLPLTVATHCQDELYKRGILSTPPHDSLGHPQRPFVLVNLAVGLVGAKTVLGIIKKHLRDYEA